MSEVEQIIITVYIAAFLIVAVIFAIIVSRPEIDPEEQKKIDMHARTLRRFFRDAGTKDLFERFNQMGCIVDSFEGFCDHNPVYINFIVEGTDIKPFIGFTAPGEMVNNNVSMWMAIDDKGDFDEIHWQFTPDAIARAIADDMGVDVSPAIIQFTTLALETRQHVYAFNKKNSGPNPQ